MPLILPIITTIPKRVFLQCKINVSRGGSLIACGKGVEGNSHIFHGMFTPSQVYVNMLVPTLGLKTKLFIIHSPPSECAEL